MDILTGLFAGLRSSLHPPLSVPDIPTPTRPPDRWEGKTPGCEESDIGLLCLGAQGSLLEVTREPRPEGGEPWKERDEACLGLGLEYIPRLQGRSGLHPEEGDQPEAAWRTMDRGLCGDRGGQTGQDFRLQLCFFKGDRKKAVSVNRAAVTKSCKPWDFKQHECDFSPFERPKVRDQGGCRTLSF